MKYVVCIPDGCADEPYEGLGARTPLEVANMPTLRALAQRGTVGAAAVIPEGFDPGSDVGNMSILGFDPADYHTGRAPIEAAALGVEVADHEVAFRCNLVTISDDGVMVDFAGGHPNDAVAELIIKDLDATLGGAVRFFPGVQYRHVMVAESKYAAVSCTPPHDITGQLARWPTGSGAEDLIGLMEASRSVVPRPETSANAIWLWGQGSMPRLPSFTSRYGVSAGLCTAVDLVRGLAVLADMEIHEVEGATAHYDTNYEGKRDAALAALDSGNDLFVIHVEATDEAGHAGDADAKVEALENWDRRILSGLVEGLDAMGPWRMLLLPDHATPLGTRTHSAAPVPYLIVDSAHEGSGGLYTEAAVAGSVAVPGHELMGRLLQRNVGDVTR